MKKYIILAALCLISTCLLGVKMLNAQEIEADSNRYCVCLPYGGCACTPDEDEGK
jgi:hypothetical protein